jgi:hypothetical protein
MDERGFISHTLFLSLSFSLSLSHFLFFLLSAVPDLDTQEEEKWFHIKRFESEKGIRDFRWDSSGKVREGRKGANMFCAD